MPRRSVAERREGGPTRLRTSYGWQAIRIGVSAQPKDGSTVARSAEVDRYTLTLARAGGVCTLDPPPSPAPAVLLRMATLPLTRGSSQANLRCLTEGSRDFHIVAKNKPTMQIHVQSIT